MERIVDSRAGQKKNIFRLIIF